MVMWLYVPDRRLTKKEMTELPRTKHCLACGGGLMRLAERMTTYPYQWVPDGYICAKCNLCYMGVP
jgi:hypothetical protein